MSDPTDDIDALSAFLLGQPVIGPRWHAALTALVAERDELKEKAKMLDTVIGERNEYEAITNDLRIQLDSAKSFWRDRAERRDAEQKSAADRDLRERLVCAIWPEIMRQWREFKTAIDPRGDALADALIEADKMLAAMRKGDTNA